ncbi:MAG: MMPL family transporter [Pirellulales bacterium]|nr:MMPL family transporter [Pirellulales bacterium]
MLATVLSILDRRRTATAVIVVLLIGVSLYFASTLRIVDSPERWMPQTTQAAWTEFARHFDAGDSVGIGVHFTRPITDEDVAPLRGLRNRLRAIDGVHQVYDPSLVAEQIERIPLTDLIDPANADAYDLYAGALWERQVPVDGSRTLLIVAELVFHPGEDLSSPDTLNARRRHVAEQVESIIATEKASDRWGDDVEFHVAGSIILMSEMEKRTRQVAFAFFPLSLLVGLVTLGVVLRSWQAVQIAVGGGLVAIVLVLGVLGIAGGTLGVVTVAAPALMTVVAVASTVHFAVHASQHGPAKTRAEREKLVRWVAVPCFGAAATTGIGFLMLSFNELAPIRDLGLLMFAGSLLAFFAVFVMNQWISLRTAHRGSTLSARRLRGFALKSARWPVSMVVAAGLLIGFLCFAAWPRPKDSAMGLHIDADPFSFFSREQPVKLALDHFSRRKFAVYQLDVVLIPKDAGTPAVGLNPADERFRQNQQVAKEFSELIARRADLGVLRAVSTMNFQDRYDAFLNEMVDKSDEMDLLSGLLQSGRFATSANVLANAFRAWKIDKADENAMRLTFVTHDTSEGFAPLVNYVKQNLPTEDFQCYLAGSVAQNVDLTNGLAEGMLFGLGTTFVVTFGLCVLLFRSLKLALIALLPNIFPVLVVLGVMGAFKIPISSGSAMVATIAVGIALNDTIHFMLHYRQRTRAEGHTTATAVVETMQSMGRPIVLTSIVHIAGFAIFLLTDFLPLYQFGLLSAVAMVAALVGDLILLPNLLLVFDRKATRTRRAFDQPLREPSPVSGTLSTSGAQSS